jgi:hypothetical protein
MALKFIMYGSLRTGSEAGIAAPLYEIYTATDGQQDFTLAGSFRAGLNELEVYVNGQRQYYGIDYTEPSDKDVHFIEPLEADDKVLFMVREVRNTTLHQEFVASAGQTHFTLARPYRLGSNSLQVYVGGQLQRIFDDYVEADDTTVIFLYGLQEGDKVTFKEIV